MRSDVIDDGPRDTQLILDQALAGSVHRIPVGGNHDGHRPHHRVDRRRLCLQGGNPGDPNATIQIKPRERYLQLTVSAVGLAQTVQGARVVGGLGGLERIVEAKPLPIVTCYTEVKSADLDASSGTSAVGGRRRRIRLTDSIDLLIGAIRKQVKQATRPVKIIGQFALGTWPLGSVPRALQRYGIKDRNVKLQTSRLGCCVKNPTSKTRAQYPSSDMASSWAVAIHSGWEADRVTMAIEKVDLHRAAREQPHLSSHCDGAPPTFHPDIPLSLIDRHRRVLPSRLALNIGPVLQVARHHGVLIDMHSHPKAEDVP